MKYIFKSELRNDMGKNSSYRLRKKGYVPAVVYGNTMNTLSLGIELKQIETFLRSYGENSLVELDIGGVGYTAFIKEVQRHPVTGKVIHVDFQQVSQNEKVHVNVPIILKGKSLVERRGTIVQQQMKDLEIECYAGNIPPALELDISQFKSGDILKVGDMEFGEEISILSEPHSVVASVGFAKDGI